MSPVNVHETSYRHQIRDGTGRRAYHPIEVLYDALAEKV